MHRSPTLIVEIILCREDHVDIYSMVKEETDLYFVVFSYQFNETLKVAELSDMFFFVILLNNLSTDLAFGRVTIADDSMCC